MRKPSPQLSRLFVTLLLACLIFSALAASGFTLAGGAASFARSIPLRLDNVIQNGDFERFPTGDVAAAWQPYTNGQAHLGWYDERWAEAVHSGKHAQLMEIFQVEGPIRDRVIAIYQTVAVVPNMNYFLTIHALMRSDAPADLRNQGDYAMHWGIDYQGAGNYDNVSNWITMTLTEQARRGSGHPDPAEAEHLVYERITATVTTTNTGRLTLFIRGVKFEPTGTEVNFDVDDVSLIGPYPLVQPTPTPVVVVTIPLVVPTLALTGTPVIVIPGATPVVPPPAATPALPVTGQEHLPAAGAALPANLSLGMLLLAGLVFVVLGARAMANLLRR